METHCDFAMQPEPTVEALEEEYKKLFDEWCWETGDDKDIERLNELEIMIKRQRRHDAIFDEIISAAAENMRKEVDKELLEMLSKECKK